ncbi:unnamed protein product [Caenorhabditis bovis]|uniref:Uncharacterized protein n=1 Tax=Caenorhabditis bovis TaxID=2654633 RepID=A0A8S1E8Z8_9PELO|nr:unnamed protein product [Caenorhabditis bovis]
MSYLKAELLTKDIGEYDEYDYWEEFYRKEDYHEVPTEKLTKEVGTEENTTISEVKIGVVPIPSQRNDIQSDHVATKSSSNHIPENVKKIESKEKKKSIIQAIPKVTSKNRTSKSSVRRRNSLMKEVSAKSEKKANSIHKTVKLPLPPKDFHEQAIRELDEELNDSIIGEPRSRLEK